jgi:hypothetical protein
MAEKLTKAASEDSDTMAPTGRKLFLVLVACLGTFRYAFICGSFLSI